MKIESIVAVITTVSGGFKKPLSPPVNDSLIRVLGTELQPIINAQRAINESMEDIYQKLAVEVHHSNPCTEEGKDLERILLDLLHAQGTRATADLYDVASRMRAFKMPSPVPSTAAIIQKEPAHA